MTEFSYPFQINDSGGVATVGEDQHILQLVEEVLLTIQGERVNRPTFGTNIAQLVFASNSDELATATQLLVQGALQQWLGSIIKVESVKAESEESALHILVEYTTRLNQQRRTVTFSKEI